MDKKVYLCNRVVRCSKAQHTSEFALSLNRYHKIETLLFYSDTQLDTVFLTILCKDSESRVLRQIYLHFVGWNMRNEARCIVFENPFPVPAICSVIFAGDSLRCEYASRIKKDGSRNSRLSQCVAAGRLTLPSEPIRRAAH